MYSWRSGLGGVSLPNFLYLARLRVVNIPNHFSLSIALLCTDIIGDELVKQGSPLSEFPRLND